MLIDCHFPSHSSSSFVHHLQSYKMSLAGAGKLGEAITTFAPGSNSSSKRHPWYPPQVDASHPIKRGELMLHNTLTGTKQPFIPKDGRTVRWYTCGPTVYDSSHVGHARTYLSLDIMRRIMSDYFHYNLIYQINITDIDDKIILRSRQNKLIDNLKQDVQTAKTSLEELKTLIIVLIMHSLLFATRLLAMNGVTYGILKAIAKKINPLLS